jgi:class 3 adenylate cyclase
MSPGNRRRVRTLLFLWLLSLIAAIIEQHGIRGITGPRGLGGEDLVADAIICAIAVLALAKVRSLLLPGMKRQPIYLFAPVAAIVYLLVILFSACVGIALIVFIATGSPGMVMRSTVRFLSNPDVYIYPLGIAIFLSFLVELSRRVGPAKIGNWLLGKYRNPKEEERVFLFVDLRGSTTLAEQLGALQFSYLLRDIFDDLSEPAYTSGGDVVGYVGDEAVISWPSNGAPLALQCYDRFLQAVHRSSASYKSRYGVQPQFRAAIHAGPVVATEVGQITTQVVLHGDALNTAARVLDKCRDLNVDLLVAESVKPQLQGSWLSLGSITLRGRTQPIQLYTPAPAGDQ